MATECLDLRGILLRLGGTLNLKPLSILAVKSSRLMFGVCACLIGLLKSLMFRKYFHGKTYNLQHSVAKNGPSQPEHPVLNTPKQSEI